MRLLLSNAPWAGAVVCVKASIDIVIGQIVLLGLCGNQIPFILEESLQTDICYFWTSVVYEYFRKSSNHTPTTQELEY